MSGPLALGSVDLRGCREHKRHKRANLDLRFVAYSGRLTWLSCHVSDQTGDAARWCDVLKVWYEASYAVFSLQREQLT